MSTQDQLPRLDASQLAAVLAESVCYGIYIVLLIQCVTTLVHRSKVRKESILKPMPITAGVLFITITSHWILDILLAFEAFILPKSPGYCVTPTSLNPAERVYLNLPDPKNVLTSGFYVTTTLVGDGFMIYRLFIVWSKNKFIVILPLALWVSLAVTGSMVTYLFSQAMKPLFQAAGAWITSCFVLTFLCNLFSTSLIAFKIFMSNRRMGRVELNTRTTSKVMEILVESAVLYSLCVVLTLGTYVAGSNVQFTIVVVNGPVIGIIFCTIVTRTHRILHNPSYLSSSNWTTSNSHHLRPMAVKVTTQIEGDSHPKGIVVGTPPASPQIYPMDFTHPQTLVTESHEEQYT